MPTLVPRYYECRDGFGNYYNCSSSRWNDWVRWVVLAVVVIGFFLLFVMCSCITARRRRKAGQQPFYGTGWASRPGANAQPYYNNNYQPPPPQYSAQPQQGGYYNTGANQGYYGNNGQNPYPYGQANGVELQQPQQSHLARGGEDEYMPPPGPPPTKGDGIIR